MHAHTQTHVHIHTHTHAHTSFVLFCCQQKRSGWLSEMQKTIGQLLKGEEMSPKSTLRCLKLSQQHIPGREQLFSACALLAFKQAPSPLFRDTRKGYVGFFNGTREKGILRQGNFLFPLYGWCTYFFSYCLGPSGVQMGNTSAMSSAGHQASMCRSEPMSPGWSWTQPETEMGAQRSPFGWSFRTLALATCWAWVLTPLCDSSPEPGIDF